MPLFGLVKRKEIWLPTWRGWLLVCLLAVALVIGAVQMVVPFLSPNQPLRGPILVVEGWLPDYNLDEAKQVFERHGYRLVMVTGVPIEEGFHISGETDYAQLAFGALRSRGLKEEAIIRVPCANVPKDRTYATAREVRVWLDRHAAPGDVDVLTRGVHARRTWLLYRLALGDRYPVGIIAGRDRRFHPSKWWQTSSGFRTVTSELIAYVYAKFLFRPAPTDDL